MLGTMVGDEEGQALPPPDGLLPGSTPTPTVLMDLKRRLLTEAIIVSAIEFGVPRLPSLLQVVAGTRIGLALSPGLGIDPRPRHASKPSSTNLIRSRFVFENVLRMRQDRPRQIFLSDRCRKSNFHPPSLLHLQILPSWTFPDLIGRLHLPSPKRAFEANALVQQPRSRDHNSSLHRVAHIFALNRRPALPLFPIPSSEDTDLKTWRMPSDWLSAAARWKLTELQYTISAAAFGVSFAPSSLPMMCSKETESLESFPWRT